MSLPKLAVIDDGLMGAAEAIATTEALCDLHRAGRIGATLRFCRYERSVLLGRHQDASVIDAGRCAREGVTIVRRLSGGGAVAMDAGVLTWDLIVSRREVPAIDKASAMVGAALAAALADLGVTAGFHPPGDVRADGRKLSGSSGFFDGDTMLHQGTVLVDADLAAFAGWLGFDPAVARAQMVSLSQLPGFEADPDLVANAFAARLADALGHEPRHRRPCGKVEAMVRARLSHDDGEPPFLPEKAPA